MKTEGYKVKDYGQAVKRYVQTMDLKDDAALIAEYRRRHSEPEAWKEVLDGIRAVGILDMQLFILGTRLVMIVETPLDFDCLASRNGKTIWPSSSSARKGLRVMRNGK